MNMYVINIHDACQKHEIAHDSKKKALLICSLFYVSVRYVYYFYGRHDTVDRYF